MGATHSPHSFIITQRIELPAWTSCALLRQAASQKHHQGAPRCNPLSYAPCKLRPKHKANFNNVWTLSPLTFTYISSKPNAVTGDSIYMHFKSKHSFFQLKGFSFGAVSFVHEEISTTKVWSQFWFYFKSFIFGEVLTKRCTQVYVQFVCVVWVNAGSPYQKLVCCNFCIE